MTSQEIQLHAVAAFLKDASDHDMLDAFELIASCDCWHCIPLTKLPLPMAIYMHSLFVILYPPPISKVMVYRDGIYPGHDIILTCQQSHPSLS